MTAEGKHVSCPANGRLLYVAHGDPWSPWTSSGFLLNLCRGLQARGALYGAIGRHAITMAELHGPRPAWRFVHRVRRRLGLKGPRWNNERDGLIGKLLRRMPPGSPVIYQYMFPKFDESLPLRRFLFQDMTVRDAYETKSYGHHTLSEQEFQKKRLAQKRAIEAVDGVITFSTYAAESICHEYGYPREKTAAIGCGPVRSLGPEKLTLERYAAGRILFVGRNWERKGGPILLEAFREVRQQVPHATLTIVGPLERPTHEPGVVFLGRVSDAEVRQAFTEASLFCMPAICETWGIVYVEAAHAGLPIVGFNMWALPDVVDDGQTGRLTEERTPNALARALVETLAEPERMVEMAKAARLRVHDHLDWHHVLERLTRFLWLIRGFRDEIDSKASAAYLES